MCMCRTSNRSEQQSAFEGVGVKDGNRVAAPAIDRSKQGMPAVCRRDHHEQSKQS